MFQRFLALTLAVWTGVGIHLPRTAWGSEGDILQPGNQSCNQLCLPDAVCNRYQGEGDLAEAGASIWLGAEAPTAGSNIRLPEVIRVAARGNQCQINGGAAFNKPADLTCDAVAGQALVCRGVAGQQMSYCQSYKLANNDGYKAGQATLIALDLIMGSLYLTAFILKQVVQTKAAGEALAQALPYVGMGVTVLEMILGFVVKEQATQEWFGVGSTVIAGVNAVSSITAGVNSLTGNNDQVITDATLLINSAAFYTLAGLRAAAMEDTRQAGEGSCAQLRELASDAPPVRQSGWEYQLGDATAELAVGGAPVSVPGVPQAHGGGNVAEQQANETLSCVGSGKTLQQCSGHQSLATSGPDAAGLSNLRIPFSNGSISPRDVLANLRKNGMASAVSATLESMGVPAARAQQLGQGVVKMQKAALKDPELRKKIFGGGGGEQMKEAILASKGGGAAPAKKGGMDFDWGAKTPASAAVGAVGATMEFAKPAEKLATPLEGDIWHETYQGSIFEIVSYRLDKSRTRVVEMEWQTPLNRALTGLKNARPVVERAPAAAGRRR